MGLRKTVCFLLVWLALTSAAYAAGYPVIVQIAPDARISNVATALRGKVLDSIPEANTYLIYVPVLPPLTPNAALGIMSVEIDFPVVVPASVRVGLLTTNSNETADWYGRQPELLRIRSNQALAYSRGRQVVIADINSKVDYAHPALAGHLTGGYDFVVARSGYSRMLPGSANLDQSTAAFLDQSTAAFLDQSTATFLDQSTAAFLDQSTASFLDGSTAQLVWSSNAAYSHGTLCAGIMVVMAPESMIMPLRVFDDAGQADIFSIAKAIRHAVRAGAHVINLSFGILGPSTSVRNAIEAAHRAGIQVVASAGNASTSTPQYPAAFPGVIAVAAIDAVDRKAVFSNYNANVYVSAPGVNIISAYPGGYYSIVSGTSFAAPMVAAESALIRSLWYTDTARAIASGVVNIDAQNPSYYGKLGHGRIDVLSAVRR